MSTISGTGTRFYGHSPVDQADGSCFATNWICFFYLPVYPLVRYRISFSEPANNFAGTMQGYYLLEQTPLVPREILSTFIWCWLVMPLVLVGPLFVIPNMVNMEDHATSLWAILGSLGLTMVMIWLLADWYDERGLRQKKTLLSRIVR